VLSSSRGSLPMDIIQTQYAVLSTASQLHRHYGMSPGACCLLWLKTCEPPQIYHSIMLQVKCGRNTCMVMLDSNVTAWMFMKVLNLHK
jgi:hypothetical protein